MALLDVCGANAAISAVATSAGERFVILFFSHIGRMEDFGSLGHVVCVGIRAVKLEWAWEKQAREQSSKHRRSNRTWPMSSSRLDAADCK